ncbi:glycosyltransferase [Dryocola sp. LX212]
MENNNALILLATYNGARFIEESLNSFPSCVDLFVSDDCSTDATIDIIGKCEHLNISLSKGNRHGSATANFIHLINNCDDNYGYYFLADQDDCWTNEKYNRLMDEIAGLENKFGQERPILIFGDSIVTNEKLQIIDGSFFHYDGINPYLIERNPLNLYFQNVGQGATMIFNRALLKKARKINSNIYMHDWWLMLVAQTFGLIHFSDHKTLLYRQHDNNNIGANKRNVLQQVSSQFKRTGKMQAQLIKISQQINCFYDVYHDEIEDKQLMVFLQDFKEIFNVKSTFKRKLFLLKNKIYLSSLKRTIALYLYF